MENKEYLNKAKSKNLLSTIMSSENSNISKSTTNQLNEKNNKTQWNPIRKIQNVLNTVIPVGYRNESNGNYKKMKKDDSINSENNDDNSEDDKRIKKEDEEREKKVQFKSKKPPVNELYKRWCEQEKKRNESYEKINVDDRNIQLPTYGIKCNVSKADGSSCNTIRKITLEDVKDNDYDEKNWVKINKLKKNEDTEPNTKINNDQNGLKKAKFNKDKEIIEDDSKKREFEMISQNKLYKINNNEEIEENKRYEKIIVDVGNIQLPQYVLKPTVFDANGIPYKMIKEFKLEEVKDQDVIEQIRSVSNTLVEGVDNAINEVTSNYDKMQKGSISLHRQINEQKSKETEDADKQKVDEIIFRKGEYAMMNQVCEPNLEIMKNKRIKLIENVKS